MVKSARPILLSICIPTYNRSQSLLNCLNSIHIAKKNSNINFEVCISDNGSSDNTVDVIDKFLKKIPIKLHILPKNKGRVFNYVNVIKMASGKFAWFIGDDDLLLPSALNEFANIQSKYYWVDFFYINSFNLDKKFIDQFPKPFNTLNLPKTMACFSNFQKSIECNFLDLIDPKISFDFLGAMYMAAFNRRQWLQYQDVLKYKGYELNEFSSLENSFPHTVVFAHAFSKSKAYFYSKPLTVNLFGVREWGALYPLIRRFRLVQLLNLFRKQGLPFFRYLKCKNASLHFFMPDFIYILLNSRRSGLKYINIFKDVLPLFFYPNFYASPFYFFIKRIKLKL